MNWIFGVDDGTPFYVTTAKEVGKWFLPIDILWNFAHKM